MFILLALALACTLVPTACLAQAIYSRELISNSDDLALPLVVVTMPGAPDETAQYILYGRSLVGLVLAEKVGGQWVSTTLPFTGDNPTMAVDNAGKVHVVVGRDANIRYYSRTGGVWSTATVLPTSNGSGDQHMALHPQTQRPHLVYRQQQLPDTQRYRLEYIYQMANGNWLTAPVTVYAVNGASANRPRMVIQESFPAPIARVAFRVHFDSGADQLHLATSNPQHTGFGDQVVLDNTVADNIDIAIDDFLFEPNIVFTQSDEFFDVNELWYATPHPLGGWAAEPIHESQVIRHVSLAIAAGRKHVVYVSADPPALGVWDWRVNHQVHGQSHSVVRSAEEETGGGPGLGMVSSMGVTTSGTAKIAYYRVHDMDLFWYLYAATPGSAVGVAIPSIPERRLSLRVPNPVRTRGFILLRVEGLEGDSVVELLDLAGRVLLHERLESGNKQDGSVRVDTSGLAKGLYWVRVRSGGREERRKVVLIS
jgi:hypothetical protein